MSGHDNDVFVTNKVTNRDIYVKLVTIEGKVDRTNGKVRLNRLLISGLWTAVTALGAAVGLIIKTLLSR